MGTLILYIYNPGNSNIKTSFTINSFYKNSGNVWNSSVGGWGSESDQNHTHLKILFSSGNIDKGIFSLYGIKKS